jgi:hypothetical protein
MSLRDEILKAIEELNAKSIIKTINEELGKFGNDIVSDAKENIKSNGTSNNGALINSINWTQDKDLEIEVFAGAPYAPYIEFGTKKFAGEYVSSLPKEWQDFASGYKKKGGSFDELLMNITQWVKERGIAGTYSVKTKQRTGSKKTQEEQDMAAAWPLAMKIARFGIPAQPYLYPAYVKNLKKFEDRIKEIFQ